MGTNNGSSDELMNVDGELENFYDDESLYESVDNDMISADEEGFMQGYLAA